MESGLSKQISGVLGSGDKSGDATGNSNPPVAPPHDDGLQSPKTLNPPDINVEEEL
jgi:hypothetical protein